MGDNWMEPLSTNILKHLFFQEFICLSLKKQTNKKTFLSVYFVFLPHCKARENVFKLE